MKKIIVSIIVVLTLFHGVFAYEPTQSEVVLLNKVEKILQRQAQLKGEGWVRRYINLFEKALIKVSGSDRKTYIIAAVLGDLKGVLQQLLIENEERIESELKIKELQFQKKSDFYYDYGQSITTNLKVSEACTKYFNFIDDIAKKNDFPTELIIATWGIEYGCKLGNPANGWGPFQITSQYYTPGEINLEDFGLAVQKYIDFTKGKWDYFNNNPYHNYKERFGSENINISYDNYTLRDLKLTAILYNGVSKDTTLDGNTFANANLNENVSHASDGVVTRFLKVLKWRIDNN